MLLFHSSKIEGCNYSFFIFSFWIRCSNRFWVQQNWCPKNLKTIFFQDRYYSFKAHAYYFTVLIYFATSRTAKLVIFIHFASINWPRCRQSINSLMYVYYTDPHVSYERLVLAVIALLHTTVAPPSKKNPKLCASKINETISKFF